MLISRVTNGITPFRVLVTLFITYEAPRPLSKTRFPSSPLIIRVPFFLLFGFNKGTTKKKGKRVLLGNLEDHEVRSRVMYLSGKVVEPYIGDLRFV